MEIPDSERQVPPIVNFGQEFICKFCLDTCNQLSPCKCSGSLKYVHEKCLLFWINTKPNLIRVAGDIHEFRCETCRTPICVAFKKRYKFVNGCQNNTEEMCTMFAIIVALSVSVAFSIVALTKAEMNGEIAIEFEYVLSIILLPFQIILLCISTKLWLIDLFIKEQKQDLKLMKSLE